MNGLGDPLPERRLPAEAAAEHEQLRVERVHEHGEYLSKRGDRLFHQPLPGGIRQHRLGPLEARTARERPPARDLLDRRRPEHDRATARPGVRLTVHDEANARSGADDDVEERRAAGAGAEPRLGPRGRPHVGLEHDPGSSDRARDVEAAPVDRVRAHGPALQIDHLAQADPDRQPAAAERGRNRGAVCEDGLAAPVTPGRKLLSREDATAFAVDQACGDLRAADVDPDRPRSAFGAVQNAALTAL